MMDFNTQNYWVFWTLSRVWYYKELENNVSEMGSVSSDEVGGGGGGRHILHWVP
jgi:hypothetical protein